MIRLGVSSRDLKRLCAVTDQSSLGNTSTAMPDAVLSAICELIPCDQISYQVFDPARRVYLVEQDFGLATRCLEPDPIRMEKFFWEAFWASPICSYPERTGCFTEVMRASDFMPRSTFRSSIVGELFRLQEMKFNVLVPLTPDGPIAHRLELWRADGTDFTDREQLLLTLLRPQIAEFERATRERLAEGVLTPRQSQVLRLVAEGLTNRQIANRLGLAEGTVRRHLEDAYIRLGVSSRTAAVACLAGRPGSSGPTIPP